MTPYELNILLDVYVGRPIQADAGAQLFDETLAGLCERGWIVPGGRHVTHLPTEKLHCFMQYVLELPEPEQKWAMPAAPRIRLPNGKQPHEAELWMFPGPSGMETVPNPMFGKSTSQGDAP